MTSTTRRPCINRSRFPRGGGQVSSKFTSDQVQILTLTSDCDSASEEDDDEEYGQGEVELPTYTKILPPDVSTSPSPPAASTIPVVVTQIQSRPMVDWLSFLERQICERQNELPAVTDDHMKSLLLESVKEAAVEAQNTVYLLNSLAEYAVIIPSSPLQMNKTQFENLLLKPVQEVEKKAAPHNFEDYRLELDENDREAQKLRSAVKSSSDMLHDRQQAVDEIQKLDDAIFKATQAKYALRTDFEQVKKELQASQDRLNNFKQIHSRKISQLEKQHQEAQQLIKDMEAMKQKLAEHRAKKQECEHKYNLSVQQFEEKKRIAREEFTAKQAATNGLLRQMFAPSPPLFGTQLPLTYVPMAKHQCVFCGEAKESCGQCLPCKHYMCEDCFVEAKEMGKIYDIPFFHLSCNDCDSKLESISFDTFDFIPELGVQVEAQKA